MQKAKNEYEEINLEEADIPIEDTWKAMGNLVKLGYTKSIGVSNFNSKQLARIINKENYFPVINEVHKLFQNAILYKNFYLELTY